MSHWKDFLDAGPRGGRFLPWKEVCRATGLSRTTAWRLQKRGDFPTPYAISPGRVGYREDEVEAWRISRDHSPSRPRFERAAASLRPSAVPQSQVPAPRPEPAAAPTPDSPVVDRPMPTPPTLPNQAASSAPRKAGRRRSQHGQAIAQQILFDF
jgi:predicted DNA-binding transcriptional regulator AlpA